MVRVSGARAHTVEAEPFAAAGPVLVNEMPADHANVIHG